MLNNIHIWNFVASSSSSFELKSLFECFEFVKGGAATIYEISQFIFDFLPKIGELTRSNCVEYQQLKAESIVKMCECLYVYVSLLFYLPADHFRNVYI